MTVPPRLFETAALALKPTRYGPMMYFPADRLAGRSLDLYGEWCEGELRLMRQGIQADDWVVDFGAGIGTHTVALAKAAPQGRVVAVEADRAAFQALAGNLALNGLDNVRVYHAAAEAAAGVDAPVLQLDALALERCNFIRIDLDGPEGLAALRGAGETIRRHRPILYVANNTAAGSAELIAETARLGYRCWWHFCHYFNADNHFRNPNNVFDGVRPEASLLCTPAEFNAEIGGLMPLAGADDNYIRAGERLMAQRRG